MKVNGSLLTDATWRMGFPVDGSVVIGSPPFIGHKKAIRKGSPQPDP